MIDMGVDYGSYSILSFVSFRLFSEPDQAFICVLKGIFLVDHTKTLSDEIASKFEIIHD